MKKSDLTSVTRRNTLIYTSAVILSRFGTRFLSNTHEEISPEIFALHKQGYRFLYIGLHKSLWETTGVQSIIHRNHLNVPYAAMGDNLIRGRFYQAIAKRSGLFLVKRASGRQGLLESAASLKEAIKTHINAGIDVIIYPEGTRKNIPQYGRYGTFFTTVFEAALELSQTQEKFALIPVNVDYSHIREDHEMLHPDEKNPRTLHMMDSLKMLSHLGDIYVNLGTPVLVNQAHWNRKNLAAHMRQSCFDLIKILPVNIISSAIYDLHQKGQKEPDSLYREIENTINTLSPFQDRFRGLTLQSSGTELFNTVASKRREFRRWFEDDQNLLRFFKLYRDYIGPLMSPESLQP